jgi:RimJ/RimL family protein N-acetyltransferase
VLLSFKTNNPLEFVHESSYSARIDTGRNMGIISLVSLDGSSERFMDMMLVAMMDLAAEGKTISEIRYKGKGTRRWFQSVFPSAFVPAFFGILDRDNAMLGYLILNKSVLSHTRKGLGIALVSAARGQGIGYHVIKHVQDNLDKMFKPTMTELIFETMSTNLPMVAIARKLGFKEEPFPTGGAWGEPPPGWMRFLWVNTSLDETGQRGLRDSDGIYTLESRG